MITVNGGVQVGWGVREILEKCVQSMGEMGKDLKKLTEGAVTTEAGSLFQYFTTLIENADPLLRRWLAPWSTW